MPVTEKARRGTIDVDWPVIAFWASLLVPGISYVLYPLAVIGLAAVRGEASDVGTNGAWPSVTVCIAAHDEERTIARAVRSVLAQEYPGARPRVLVGLDGCRDGTGRVVQAIGDARAVALDLPRAGKATTDNRLVAASDTDVVVTTSAGSEFPPGTLMRLVEPLRDPAVGCASGVFRPRRDGSEPAEGEGIYWRFEYRVMQAESRLGILAMASGTALAFRRQAFRPIPAESDADVVVAPTVVLHGARVVHVPDAIVLDDGPASLGVVLRSRRRMALRALPATARLIPRLVRAGHPGAAVGLLAHKLFRWLTPIAGIVWAASAVALVVSGDAMYSALTVGIVGLGLAGLTLALVAGPRTRGAIVSLLIAQLAFALAVVDVLAGRRAATWTRG